MTALQRKEQGACRLKFKFMFAQVTPMDGNRMFELAQGLAAAKADRMWRPR
jgi:hypothetical protein